MTKRAGTAVEAQRVYPAEHHRRWLRTLWAVAALCSAVPFVCSRVGGSAADLAPPSEIYGGLFAAVQTAGLFADSKEFADAVPRQPPAEIVAAWRTAQRQSDFSLRAFVKAHFDEQAAVEPVRTTAHLSLCAHIEALWGGLVRRMDAPQPGSSLLALPYPALVPGGRFREMYYWDSYFSLLGVADTGRSRTVQQMVDNFAYLIDRYGFVPNGTRSYYLSRSQPPFFYELVALTSPGDAASAFARYLPELKREYAFWMQGEGLAEPGLPHRRVVAFRDGTRLNRYWDDRAMPRDEAYAEDVALARRSPRPAAEVYRDVRAAAESGWDFSSRWLADAGDLSTIQTTHIVPVDLNCLLYGLETSIRDGCARQGDLACVREFDRRAALRTRGIHRYLWQAEQGIFGDYDWQLGRATARISAAMLYPLFTGVANLVEAHRVARVIEASLLKPGGLAATPLQTGQQWDLPNGWAPLQWIAVRGLKSYGEDKLAQSIAERWLGTVERVYGDTGKLVEKYDVVDPRRKGGGGEYPLQDGFGWTNGVVLHLTGLYPRPGRACLSSVPAR